MHTASGRCSALNDLDPALPGAQGGGCIDLLDCDQAAAHDARASWELRDACVPTWARCGGGGMHKADCCNSADTCTNSNASAIPFYTQCVPP